MALSWLLLLCFISTLFSGHYSASEVDGKKAYIVYMGDKLKDEVSTQSDIHANMVEEVVGSDAAQGSLLHSYKRSFNGFAARLTDEEAQEMAEKEGVVSVFPSEIQKLETTRSWDFIGFPLQVKRSKVESNIIIGVIDTGIWPGSSSFDDKGFGPPPAKWKGTCQASHNFSCNNKIIGARYYFSEELFYKGDVKSPLDSDGHGTHTASTAAGGAVGGASVLGFAPGTARGAVPSARIAVYKVCWIGGCSDASILAAFDDAIADGVDIISVSLSSTAVDYLRNVNAIGAFHAVRKGILTSFSAGNRGPNALTVRNVAPWSLSVAASTIDRDFLNNVKLGNSKTYQGKSINTFDLKNQMFPMIYGGDAPNTSAGYFSSESRYCYPESLDKDLVKGKILLCDQNPGDIPDGVVGIIVSRQVAGQVADVSAVPEASLFLEDFTKTYTYVNSTSNPTASISKSTEEADKLAPYIATFSSRGPNPTSPSILKPDLSAPGVYILAAWPPYIPVSESDGDERSLSYNIISGTSMSCPHGSAAAAYVKSFHPTWSPAAIKSSLMTTTSPIGASINPDAEFAYGAGQINPLKAVDPGLVYDADEADYINFLCGQGYSTKLLQIVTGNNNSSCNQGSDNYLASDLNYPAFVLSASPSESINHVFNRTVTNVGSPTSTYKANCLAVPQGLEITVNPSVLSFSSLGEKRSYAVTVRGTIGKKIVASASLVWDDGTYQVRSPIVVYVPR